ncbi:EAL domain-containing protein [Thiobacillus denitrificans]|uniref:Diguanylate cyclase n=1 Tax=Thiobacillus denitrificans TaxID=36861 RepID=A0A106BLS4_THIDE|nr:EAL domain-containing protein [Thiobacillus denitrificans]KVW94809.1 diguanylate cyclase [Thiobacillus denitrificans]
MKSTRGKNGSVEILIAEDSPTQAEQLQNLLEGHGYRVVVAANGRKALESLRRRKPSLVISDIVMPEMNGYELCKAIKADEALRDIPVILVTTLSDVLDIMKGLECGADNFIRKPYEEKYLLARVDYLLMNQEMRKSQKMQMGMEIHLGGQRHFITAERQQIVDLLISVYEEAIHLNEELKVKQSELADSNHVLTGLYHIAEGLNHAVSERAVCEKALEHALELPGVRAGWIFLQEGESGFRLGAACNLPSALQVPGAMEGLCECRRRFLAGELDHVTSILECERLGKAKAGTQGLRYHASVPLWNGDQILGVMNLVGADQGLFREDELETLYGVGHQVGIALERARLHEHLEQLVEERTAALTAEIAERKRAEARIVRLNRIYSVLSGINTTIVRVREPQELFDEACRIAVEHGKFAFAWIGTLDADTQQVTPVARAGLDDGYLSRINLSVAEDARGNCPLTAEAITQAKPVICNDIASDDDRCARCAWRAEALQRGYRSVAMFPLLLGERPVGVFVLYAPEADVFDEEEMRLLVEMAGDISFALDHLEKEARLDYLAYYDAVTGLPNRTLFLDRVDQKIGVARRDGKVFSVIMLDLNRFSSINETLGRQAGDDLLRQITQRLQGMLGETDIFAHFSADYFGIATRCDDASVNIVHVLERMLSAIQDQPFLVGGQELRISARAGVSSYPTDGQDIEALFHNAESALKKAKLSGDRYLFYTPAFNALVAEKLSLENKLRRALEREELVLHYQPKVDLDSGQISGLEALLRWNDPENGLVPPLKFIPLLEETGMILEAGLWALEKAVADSLAWQAKGLRSPRVAVNVSPIQLQQKDFVSMIERVVKGDREVAGRLELEITESLIMQDIEANIEKLQAIREMGVEVAIDDFGTGYSSLSYIAKLPVSTLKIDRAFIMNMTSNADDLSIVSTIISLAHSLKMRVVAEGVETGEQARFLRVLKCDEIQGFLFSPGVPAEQIEQFLREQKLLPG